MIKSFKHKGLKQLFEKGITSGVPAQDAERINDRLQAIDMANDIRELDRQKGIAKGIGQSLSEQIGALHFNLFKVMLTF